MNRRNLYGGARGRNPFRRPNNRPQNGNNPSNQGRRWNQNRNPGRNNNSNNNNNNSWTSNSRNSEPQERGQHPTGQDPRGKTCFLCKQPGHFVANCHQWKKLQAQTANNTNPKSNLAAIEHQKPTEEVSSLEPINPWNGMQPWNQAANRSTYPF